MSYIKIQNIIKERVGIPENDYIYFGYDDGGLWIKDDGLIPYYICGGDCSGVTTTSTTTLSPITTSTSTAYIGPSTTSTTLVPLTSTTTIAPTTTTTTTCNWQLIQVLSAATYDSISSYSGSTNIFGQSITALGRVSTITVQGMKFGNPVFNIRAKAYSHVPLTYEIINPPMGYIGKSINVISSVDLYGDTYSDMQFMFGDVILSGKSLITFEYESISAHDDSNYVLFELGLTDLYTSGSSVYYSDYYNFWVNAGNTEDAIFSCEYCLNNTITTTTTTTLCPITGGTEIFRFISVNLKSPTETRIISTDYELAKYDVCYLTTNFARISDAIGESFWISGDEVTEIYLGRDRCLFTGTVLIYGGEFTVSYISGGTFVDSFSTTGCTSLPTTTSTTLPTTSTTSTTKATTTTSSTKATTTTSTTNTTNTTSTTRITTTTSTTKSITTTTSTTKASVATTTTTILVETLFIHIPNL